MNIIACGIKKQNPIVDSDIDNLVCQQCFQEGIKYFECCGSWVNQLVPLRCEVEAEFGDTNGDTDSLCPNGCNDHLKCEICDSFICRECWKENGNECVLCLIRE